MMERLDNNQAGIMVAATVIANGGVIVYPTDTAYALGGCFDDRAVIDEILAIKGRTDQKFTLICTDETQVKRFFAWTEEQHEVAQQYWPGPLSVAVDDHYAVRVPDSAAARQLAAAVGQPLIATSANISGQPTLYSAAEVIAQFADQQHQPAAIIDAGQLPQTMVSTLVKVHDGKIVVLREGAVQLPITND